ncbi:DUF6075 family protein [Vallitalea sp.]|jgi:hypothetical protein|uniref:DUF6075 family protein n=1 Tax=Vallitalea sp. TaxID=1882829 RepID=UPI0025E4BCAC|nr:DUF6075 family protein [Vallitalea sp.]MCT4686583.1 DUF6075 family protein [Vallitalea sp.]
MEQLFLNEEHITKYNILIQKGGTNKNDSERNALFFILSGNIDLYQKADYIYDFVERCIEPECLNNTNIDFCTSSIALIKLAYNLYNGYKTEETILCILKCLDKDNLNLCINGLKVRFTY